MDAKRWIACVWTIHLCCHVLAEVDSRITNTNQQNLQKVLYSIEERLRSLDILYAPAPRYQSRQWDSELYTRVEAIESRINSIETSLNQRLDKIVEEVSTHQMKQELANDQMVRKIDGLYERLNHRMGYTEKHLDSVVTKIRTSIEAGFVRIGRSEREAENLEIDIETQVQELQRQFDGFENNQNLTLVKLTELSSQRCRNELNDEDSERDFSKKDIESFAQSMESSATKVTRMVNEFAQRTLTMESLVKNSMSLSNATRRELQDGIRSLGLRLVHHGTKASSYEFGWDALASLITKEFGNLDVKLSANHETVIEKQTDFQKSCHRLQEHEQQLSAKVADVLENILDLIRNRSKDMEKHVVSFQEILKDHNTQIMKHSQNRELDSSADKLQQGINTLVAGVQSIQEQITELSLLNSAAELQEMCLNASANRSYSVKYNVTQGPKSEDYEAVKSEETDYTEDEVQEDNVTELKLDLERMIATESSNGTRDGFSKYWDRHRNMTQAPGEDRNESERGERSFKLMDKISYDEDD